MVINNSLTDVEFEYIYILILFFVTCPFMFLNYVLVTGVDFSTRMCCVLLHIVKICLLNWLNKTLICQ